VGIGLVLLVEALISKTWQEGLLRGVVLIPYVYLAYLLVRNVKSEIAQRERAERLAAELKKARDELAVAYEKLKELDKLKDEFISIASHELNTPLAAIQGYLSMILDEKLVKVDKQAEEWLRHTYESAKRLAALVRDLLDVSRIEQGRMKLEKKEIDICYEIETVMAEFQSMARNKGLELVFEGFTPSSVLPLSKGEEGGGVFCPKVLADSMRIREVLANLISNAIKYTKKGRVTIL
jgi:signal transduction histidine kinase